jgi:hypothetical protein
MQQGAINVCDSLSVLGCSGGAQVHVRLEIPHGSNFGAVKSGERAGQRMSPNRVIGWPGNTDIRKAMLCFAMWAVTSYC